MFRVRDGPYFVENGFKQLVSIAREIKIAWI